MADVEDKNQKALNAVNKALKEESMLVQKPNKNKEGSNVLVARPTVRSILILLLVIILPNSLISLVLAFRAKDSLFWNIFDPDNYDIDFRLLVFWSLISLGLVGIVLLYSSYQLLRDP